MNNNKKELEKAYQKNSYAATALVIMTCMNVVLGILMVQRVLPIWLGMCISFAFMGLISLKAHKDLLEKDETVWESKEKFHERRARNMNDS